jgi:hypothetical protein
MATRDVVRSEFLPRRPRFTPAEALHVARTMAKDRATTCAHGRKVEGQCGHLIACNYGFGALGILKAIDLWEMLPKKYRRPGRDRMQTAPAGALLFWSGGSDKNGRAGHTGISDGRGNLLGNDLPDMGRFGRFPTADVTKAFTLLEPEGWAFPFFEVATHDTRKPPKLADQLPREVRVVDELIAIEQDAIAMAKRAIIVRPRAEDDAILRRIIEESRQHIELARALQPT